MRMIDADALKASLKESADRCREWIQDCTDQKDDAMQRIAEQSLLTFNECALRIDQMPTIEPKTGEWIPIRKGERGYSAGDFRCSVCHQPNKCYTMTNYCSHCGAYMKPTEKNDQ